jgi:hypothetical protein
MVGSFDLGAVFWTGLTGLGTDFETDGAGVGFGFGIGFGVGLGAGSTALLKNSVPSEFFGSFPPRAGWTPSFVTVTMSLFEGLLADAAFRPHKARAVTSRIKLDFFMAVEG